MNRSLQMVKAIGVAALCVMTVAGARVVNASEPAATQDKPAPKPVIPLRVQVVISRYEGEKKTSSLPYMLSVDANGQPTSMNMGIKVPVPYSSTSKDGVPTMSYQYQNVGTNINCRATSGEAGVFELSINLDDSSLYDKQTTGGVEKLAPIIQSFNTGTYLVMHDGQTQQFTTATDKVTGEVVKVEVTLTVIK